MSTLNQKLEQLGLSQYLESFEAEGFDTWETVLDITESDLTALNVKLGHRRKLQRAIAETRAELGLGTLSLAQGKSRSIDDSYRSDDSASEVKSSKRSDPPTRAHAQPAPKRKYRRHPKPDEHAPERPASAYVIFSNQMRETLKGQELTFTEIAKIVGERWQVLPADAREACERQAVAAKEKYYSELAEYKKTSQYAQYQEYLADFKAKHSNSNASASYEGKRSKLETETSLETSTSTRSSSHDNAEKHTARRTSSGALEGFHMAYGRAGSSPPGAAILPSRGIQTSSSTSPATYSYSSMQSPRLGEQQSPILASPITRTAYKDFPYEPGSTMSTITAGDPRDRSLESPRSTHSSLAAQPGKASTTTPLAYGSQLRGVASPARRSHRESVTVPTLSHDDTTLSSDSAGTSNILYQSSMLPMVDVAKAQRLLPQPIPSTNGGLPPLDPRPPLATPHNNLQDLASRSSLAALLRASEMVSDADARMAEKRSQRK